MAKCRSPGKWPRSGASAIWLGAACHAHHINEHGIYPEAASCRPKTASCLGQVEAGPAYAQGLHITAWPSSALWRASATADKAQARLNMYNNARQVYVHFAALVCAARRTTWRPLARPYWRVRRASAYVNSVLPVAGRKGGRQAHNRARHLFHAARRREWRRRNRRLVWRGCPARPFIMRVIGAHQYAAWHACIDRY